MTFLEAAIDALVPGDDVLPSGTAAGVRIDAATHGAVLGAIARAAGGEEAFAHGDPSARASAVGDAERAVPAAFAALVLAIVEEYYDSDAVILALGWTVEPPQPNGHPLPAFDEGLLASVKLRGSIWREAERGVPPSEGRN